MSGTWEFTESECDALYNIRTPDFSMKANAKYNYTIARDKIAMKLVSLKVDPNSLPNDMKEMAVQIEAEMEEKMKKQRVRETFEVKDGKLLVTEAGQTMTFTKVPL
jgi:hypothetical protein